MTKPKLKESSDIKIMAVLHHIKRAPEVIQKLRQMHENGAINQRRGIGLEITPSLLSLFRAIHADGGSRAADSIREYSRQQLITALGKHADDPRVKLDLSVETTLVNRLFWYRLYEFAKKNSIQVVALDSTAAERRAQKAEVASTLGPNNKHAKEVVDAITTPIRERIFARRSQTLNPHISIVGVVHGDAVKNELKKRKVHSLLFIGQKS